MDTMTNFTDKETKEWRKKFDERQLKEIDFCLLYAKDFRHGTEGHNGKMIIAKLAMLLDEVIND